MGQVRQETVLQQVGVGGTGGHSLHHQVGSTALRPNIEGQRIFFGSKNYIHYINSYCKCYLYLYEYKENIAILLNCFLRLLPHMPP